MPDILVLYYSRNGAVKQMAQFIARGVECVNAAMHCVLDVRLSPRRHVTRTA